MRRPDGSVYVNSEKHWIWLQKTAAKAARWLEYVRFDQIRDERNAAPVRFIADHSGADDEDMDVVDGERIHLPELPDPLPSLSWGGGRQHRQPYRIVLFGEKSSLSEVLRPIAERVEGEMILATGESSDTLVAEMVTAAAADGRPLVILYFCDFDPSGHQMSISVARKVQALIQLWDCDLKVQIHHVALTLDQVIAHNLPSTPLKDTEKRGAKWREVMGREQTEIDALAALRPDVLRQIAEEAVAPFFDATLAARVDELRSNWEAEAEAWFEAQPAYHDAEAQITELRNTAAAAVEALNVAQQRASESLKAAADEAPIPPDDTIEAEVTATAPTPMFTTTDSFADASRKLFDRKKLIGLGDEAADDSDH